MSRLDIKSLYELAQPRVSENVSPEEALRQVICESGVSDSKLVDDMVERNLPQMRTAEEVRSEDPGVQFYYGNAQRMGEKDP